MLQQRYKEIMIESFGLSALLISIIAGLFLGVPSGPALFFVLDTSMKVGKSAALRVYGGFMGAKLVYMSLALLANDYLSSHKKLESVFYLVASSLLVVWGIIIMIRSRKKNRKEIKECIDGRFLKRGFGIGLTNPVIPFIYLTFLQFINLYSSQVGTFTYLLYIAVLEVTSFLVLAGIAKMLKKGGGAVENHWNKVVGLMGVFLFCAGSYQVYQLVDIKEGGISLRQEKNVLEQQLQKVEEETGSPSPE